MSLATALQGAVADARPLQNPDFRRLWVTQIITMIGAQLTAARLEGQADTGVCQPNGVTGSWLLLPACAEAAAEGDVERVQGGLPAVGPPLASLAGRVEAHDRQVQAPEGGLLGRE
jgi:hypothetical protein